MIGIDYEGGLAAAAAAAERMPRVQARAPGWLAPAGGGGGQGAGLGGVMDAMRTAKAGQQGKPSDPEQPGLLSRAASWAGRQLGIGAEAGPSAYQAPGAVEREALPDLPADVPVSMVVPPGAAYPPGYAVGGLAARGARRARRVGAMGLVHSASPGRADLVEGALRRGSYVLPADVVSGLGEGNTLAGAKLLHASLPELADMAARGPVNHAAGGLADDGEIEVRLSGGEFLVSPEQVLEIGGGDVEAGASALDGLVRAVRGSTREALGRMPPPK